MTYLEKLALLRRERESVRDEIKAKEADGQQVDLFTFLDILRKNRPDFSDESHDKSSVDTPVITDMQGGVAGMDANRAQGFLSPEDFMAEYIGMTYAISEMENNFQNAYSEMFSLERIKTKLAEKHYIPIQPTLSDLVLEDVSTHNNSIISVSASVTDPDNIFKTSKLHIYVSENGEEYTEKKIIPIYSSGRISFNINDLAFKTAYYVKVEIQRNGMFNDPSTLINSITPIDPEDDDSGDKDPDPENPGASTKP